MMKSIGRAWALGLCILTTGPGARAATWFPLGPFGGDARSFASDPKDSKHLYLGTATGWIYTSSNGGAEWTRLSQVGKRDDLVLAHILIDAADARHITVGAFAIDHPDGGLYQSHDGGATWYNQAQMRGQSVRSLTSAPSDPRIMVAGTLEGVYRTMDSGVHWSLISPAASTEIHEVESVAVDPVNPDIIYAGTWHLPWKTVDGGANWVNIKEGLIDDSDVFSILVDPRSPQVVYASACSGIYKSVDAGAKFTKVQGIPSSARRTRRLTQDPINLETVFAGTTEGLYRTTTAGATWSRLTGPDVIVNDVFVDPNNSDHVLLATDRAGVVVSEDGGTTFQPSNTGFSARQVTAFASDPRRASLLYAGVVNDKDWGGVFLSADGGVHWEQHSAGLNGRDVFSLTTLADGSVLAGTGHGIMRLEEGMWVPSGALAGVAAPASAAVKPRAVRPRVGKFSGPGPAAGLRGQSSIAAKKGGRTAAKPSRQAVSERVASGGQKLVPRRPAGRTANGGKQASGGRGRPEVAAAPVQRPADGVLPGDVLGAPVADPGVKPGSLDAVVYAFVTVGETVFAGTSKGLMQSAASGREWSPVTSLTLPETRFLASYQETIAVATLREAVLSNDGGKSWEVVKMPESLTQVSSLAVDELGNVWIGGREGVFYTPDRGATWKTLRNLFLRHVSSLYFDGAGHRVLATAGSSTTAFAVHLPDYQVNFWDTGWTLRFARPAGDHLIGATMFDGMVVQPVMVESKMQDAR